ncbi:MAG: sulfite exporter TauE/SafE family protein [Bacillota bacterium]
MTPAFFTTLFSLGLIGGIFSGLLGIGGGIIMVPLLLYIPPLLGLPAINMKTVAGITMVQSLAGSFSALLIHRLNRFVHIPLVLVMGLSSLAGALFGSVWSKHLSGSTMLTIFAALALIASVLLVFPIEDKDETDLAEIHFNKFLAVAIGLAVGVLGGIIGQGGAFLLIPLMLYLLRIPTRIALGSSVAIAFLSALAGFIGKWGTEQIPFLMAIALAAGAVSGAQIGGKLSKSVRTGTLRAILALLIAGTALRMGISLLSSWGTINLIWAATGLFTAVGLLFVIQRAITKSLARNKGISARSG